MRGKLSDRPFPDIARRLSNDEVTGALEVTGEPGVARVFFRTGAVYWAMSPAPRARLGDRLVNAGFITQEQLDRALEEQQRAEERIKLGALLVSKELVGRDVIRVFVQEQILDALFDLVRWHDGDWVFHPGDAVDDKLPIDVPVSQMLVEVSRRQGEWDQIQGSLPTLDAVPDHVVGGNATTAALEQDEFTMLASIDGNRSVRELASDLGYSEFEAGRIVYGLTLLGIVEITGEDGDDEELPELAEDPTEVADAAEVADGVSDEEQQGALDAALADVLGTADTETETEAAQPAAETSVPSSRTDQDDSADLDDDIDVGAALEQALFGGEPEPRRDDQNLEVTVHFALDDGVAQRSAHGSARRATDDTVSPPPAARTEPAPEAEPVGSPPPVGHRDEDEPEPWVFTTGGPDEPHTGPDTEPAPTEPAPTAPAPTAAADDSVPPRVGADDDEDLDALDDFFGGPTDEPATAEPEHTADDDEPAHQPTTTDLTGDLDELVAEFTGDETADEPDTAPAPPSGSSVPGAAAPGRDSEPADRTPAAAPSGGRGDVSEFLRELTQLNLEDEGGDEADGDDEDEEPPPTSATPPARRRDPPDDKKDDKKKKGLFGWGR